MIWRKRSRCISHRGIDLVLMEDFGLSSDRLEPWGRDYVQMMCCFPCHFNVELIFHLQIMTGGISIHSGEKLLFQWVYFTYLRPYIIVDLYYES